MKIYSILAATLLLLVSCGEKPAQEEVHLDKMSFSKTEMILEEGETALLPVDYQKWDRGVYMKSDYDFSADPCALTVTVSDPAVASVEAGTIKALKKGTATITVTSSNVTVSGKLELTVKEYQTGTYTFSQDLGQSLTSDMIVLPLGLNNTTMQGLDIDRQGTFYMAWEENDSEMRVRAFNKNGTSIGSDMVLPSGAHGDGFSIEYNSGDVYFWTCGNLGEHADGGYAGGKASTSSVRLICRHKFKAGATEYAEDAEACYYLNDNGCRMIDVDTEHNVMAFWTYEDSEDVLYVFKYSDVKNLTATVKKTVTRTSHNNGMTVEARDLRTLTPVSRFAWVRKGNVTGSTNSGAVQGLCIYDDKIYVESGAKDDEATLISVLDFNGNILQKLVALGVSKDKQQLISLGLSSDGTFEPEGIHIHEGVMYLGFVGDFPTSGSKKHCCILKLK